MKNKLAFMSNLKYPYWRPSRSLRELFFIIIVVAGISVIVTYHVSRYVLQQQQTELNLHLDGGVDIISKVRLHHAQDDKVDGAAVVNDRYHALEGLEFDEIPAQNNPLDSHQQSPLFFKLQEIEKGLLKAKQGRKVQKHAVLCGRGDVLQEQALIYSATLLHVGYLITSINSSTLKNSSCVTEASKLQPEWQFLLCFPQTPSSHDSSLHSCGSSTELSKLNPTQKVMNVDNLQALVQYKDAFCKLMMKAQDIPVYSILAHPDCYILPSDFEKFLLTADKSEISARWVVKPDLSNGDRLLRLQPTLNHDFIKLKNLHDQKVIIQHYQENPLLLFGMPFSLTTYTLLTSLSPLRTYIHQEGIVQYRYDYQRGFKKIPGRTWTLDQLQRHLSITSGQKLANTVMSNMYNAITQTMLLISHEYNKQYQRCTSCIGLISMEVIFNSSYHPIITEINTEPNFQEITRHSSANMEGPASGNIIIEDMINLIFGKHQVAADVSRALDEFSHNIGVQDFNCQPHHKTCLSVEQLTEVLKTRMESVNKGGFTELYPSRHSDKFTHILNELHDYKSSNHIVPDYLVQTYNMHHLLIGLEKFYHTMDAVQDSYDDLSIPSIRENLSSKVELFQNVFHDNPNSNEQMMSLECSEDRSAMPFLKHFQTDPKLNFTPAFDQSILEYHTTVEYSFTTVRLWGTAESCSCEARMDDKYGLSRPTNYSLGLGNNRLAIHVVDLTHTEPWTINTYIVNIYRRSSGEMMTNMANLSGDMSVCFLKQECDLKLVTNELCGLQPTSFSNWDAYKRFEGKLPNCTGIEANGSWMVPCESCLDRDTCLWQQAVWQPNECHYPFIPREHLKTCMARKQVLFIGDSTNRGMMHYTMEQLNGTLTSWDKTHDIKVHNNLNSDSTTLAFAYYPQFWLPANQRPVFDKAFYQLIKEAMPLENNHNTVLVVGGVHWLATHHLNVLKKALEKEGLGQIRVIIKGLGAGFHQPVDGLHCLTQQEQRKLLIHNHGLLEYSHRLGFDVLDTFNMTMARYKDFLQGKCACHFHRVREVLPSFTQFMKSRVNKSSELQDMPIVYHVEGDVNKAYTEILLNQICNYR